MRAVRRTGRRTVPGRRRGRVLAAGAGAAGLLAVLLTGCGIRATTVPTDAGPAPSRAPCALSGPGVTRSYQGIAVQVFLVCSSQLVTADRSVRIPAGKAEDRVRVAQALIGELRQDPPTLERQAGYTTDVESDMTVIGSRASDPPDGLRLSTSPRDLNAYALAQIVCTFANSAAAADDGSVVLGGPGTEPLRRYQCTPEVRSRPGTTAPPTARVERD